MPIRSLVVDDAKVTQLILERILSGYGECSVAKSGGEALQSFVHGLDEDRPYDLICLDMGLPDFGGLDVLMKIREIEHERGTLEDRRVRVIAITADSDIETVRAFTQLGDGYLLKPINRQSVIRHIANFGLVGPTEDDKRLIDTLSTLCRSDSLPIHTLAQLMTSMAASIQRQSAPKSGLPAAELPKAPGNPEDSS
jgi:two-component system chemotaxis response regulator CheY